MNKTWKILLIILGILILIFGGVFGYLLFLENSHDGPFVVKKPAVYLYPLQDSDVSVELDINGKLTKTIPEYNFGWDVFVTKNGIIENKYDYLFYEAELNKIGLPDEGWVVQYSDLDPWFNIKLTELGLNEKEKKQFKEYWLSELPKANYYEIKLIDSEFLNKNMNLIINPQPQTMIRLNFYFKPLNEKEDIPEPVINVPERKGFTVVEWGGVLTN